MTQPATGLARTVKTNSSGEFTVPLLAPGAYTVEMKAAGFQIHRVQDVSINVTEIQKLNVVLKVGSSSQSVTVQAEAALAQTE